MLFIAVLKNKFSNNQQNIDYLDTLKRYRYCFRGQKIKNAVPKSTPPEAKIFSRIILGNAIFLNRFHFQNPNFFRKQKEPRADEKLSAPRLLRNPSKSRLLASRLSARTEDSGEQLSNARREKFGRHKKLIMNIENILAEF